MKLKRQSAKPPPNQLCVFCWKFNSFACWCHARVVLSFIFPLLHLLLLLFMLAIVVYDDFVVVVVVVVWRVKAHKEMVNDRCKVIH